MSATENYFDVAGAYANGVRDLFSAPISPGVSPERGTERTASQPEQVAKKAEQLLPLSEALTQSASARLSDADAAVRADAEVKLLAKAATDLEISMFLLDVAEKENEATDRKASLPEFDRAGFSAPQSIEESLEVLLRPKSDLVLERDRSGSVLKDIESARAETMTEIESTFDLISRRAAKSGQKAIGGLLGLGVTEVASAVGAVGKSITDFLGVGETLSRWYGFIRSYAIKAYEAVVALLGSAAQAVSQKVLEWFNDLTEKWTGELKEGKLLDRWVKTLYETEATKRDLGVIVNGSTVGPEKYTVVIEDAKELRKLYEQRIKWSDKILDWMPTLSGVATAVIPHGMMLVAVLYVALSGYVIVAGADYVDAPRIKFLNRVPGIRSVVASNLAN
jgi:hypothetical protein